MAEPLPTEPISVVIEDEDNSVRTDPATGTIETDTPDGGVIVQLDAHRQKEDDDDEDDWFENLVDDIGDGELGRIANDLMDGITADDESRKEHLAIRARGIDLLGIKLNEPSSSVGSSSSAVEGLSTVTNPLLLEGVLKGWANAQAELLPANGACKIHDDLMDAIKEIERLRAICGKAEVGESFLELKSGLKLAK